ncbi:MAG: hypothetical protein JXJ22_12660 [Bacteroidales bacterium]|nr:hypothetical protein [Bacteroidales bacterium]
MALFNEKHIYLLKNLGRGFLWFAIIIGIFLFLKTKVDVNYLELLKPVYKHPGWVILIFILSELIVGLIPPEIFMLWALKNDSVSEYILFIIMLAFLSYGAGYIGYLFGSYLNTTRLYRFVRRRFLSKLERRLNDYGLYLIIVAAVTPLPYSGVSMLVGSVKFPVRKFLLFSTSRFLRFGVYAWIIWEANILS